jgi:hypothetical protein
MAFRESRLQKLGLSKPSCPLDGFPEGPSGVPVSEDEDQDSSVSDDVDVLGRDVELMLGELKSMEASMGCPCGGVSFDSLSTRVQDAVLEIYIHFR